jgi:hypothetical protein
MRCDLLLQVAIKRAPAGGIRVEVGVTIRAAGGVTLVCKSKSARVVELGRKRPGAEVSLVPGDEMGKFWYRIYGAAPSRRWCERGRERKQSANGSEPIHVLYRLALRYSGGSAPPKRSTKLAVLPTRRFKLVPICDLYLEGVLLLFSFQQSIIQIYLVLEVLES